jgi:hypothetical protein
MAVFLNELQAGRAEDLVGFPHLLVCMAVVVQTERYLYGFHFDGAGDTSRKATAFREFMDARDYRPRDAVALFGVSNWQERYKIPDPRAARKAWEAEMRDIAGIAGYERNLVCGFDTSILPATNGHYVEFRARLQQHSCRIFYKANDDREFTSLDGPGGPGTTLYGPDATAFMQGNFVSYSLDSFGMRPKTGEARLITGAKTAGLSELDYALRLVAFIA